MATSLMPTCTLTVPFQAWVLPWGDMQQSPYELSTQQRVEQRVDTPDEQRVIIAPADPTITRITDAPPIMNTPNTMQKRVLKLTKCTHSRRTRNNVTGSVPAIMPTALRWFIPNPPPTPVVALQCSPQMTTPANAPPIAMQIPHVWFVPIKGGVCNRNFLFQEAINFLTKFVWANSPNVFTPTKLKSKSASSCLDFAQVKIHMVHSTTNKTISSYKHLMHDPATVELWQTAFGKDFGGMAQGNNKTR